VDIDRLLVSKHVSVKMTDLPFLSCDDIAYLIELVDACEDSITRADSPVPS
jgi:hypothetical protein